MILCPCKMSHSWRWEVLLDNGVAVFKGHCCDVACAKSLVWVQEGFIFFESFLLEVFSRRNSHSSGTDQETDPKCAKPFGVAK